VLFEFIKRVPILNLTLGINPERKPKEIIK
jgi:hypothetical protein